MKTILKSSDIESMSGELKTHFLNARAVRVNKSLGDQTGLENLGFHIIEVEPGFESTEYHVHHYEEECVYILAGSATVTIDERHYPVGAGDFIAYPAGGHAHTMVNTGTQTLRCIVVGQRLAHDVSDYPRLGKRIFRNAGLTADLVDTSAIDNPLGGAK